MLVYGDIEQVEMVGDKAASIRSTLSQAVSSKTWLDRHTKLVSAFISSSELVQGIVDAEFAERGLDAQSEPHEAGMMLLSLLARSIMLSWQGDLRQGNLDPSLPRILAQFDPTQRISTKEAEGYSFYALYPESYIDAAVRSGLDDRTFVIGIRSIGTGLSALVAVALGAPAPFTVRPVGHPFQRELRIDPKVTAELSARQDTKFAIVDEGPGLSGSSFGAVADWLEGVGVSPNRIHFFPSHQGDPGPQANSRHWQRWQKAPRHLIRTVDFLLQQQNGRLQQWVESVVGQLVQPLEDISGGVWRQKRYASEAQWPASNVKHERLKFLAQTEASPWLVKFTGLGEAGERKLQKARKLYQAGFTAQVAGYCHGFLVERWHGEAQSLDQASIPRTSLIEQVGSYIGFRSRHLSLPDRQGASLQKLTYMACHNTREALRDTAAEALKQSLAHASQLESALRVIDSDNRMHSWEWLVLGQRLLKTDAIDHDASHDLIGPQDATWDIVGAVIELRLSDDETRRLCDAVREAGGHPVHPDLLALMRPCYLAFQMGTYLMAAQTLGEGREAIRLQRAGHRYASLLRAMLT